MKSVVCIGIDQFLENLIIRQHCLFNIWDTCIDPPVKLTIDREQRCLNIRHVFQRRMWSIKRDSRQKFRHLSRNSPSYSTTEAETNHANSVCPRDALSLQITPASKKIRDELIGVNVSQHTWDIRITNRGGSTLTGKEIYRKAHIAGFD